MIEIRNRSARPSGSGPNITLPEEAVLALQAPSSLPAADVVGVVADGRAEGAPGTGAFLDTQIYVRIRLYKLFFFV